MNTILFVDVYVPEEPTYDDFVRVSKEIMKGRTPEQQKTLVLDVLKTLLPDFATRQFRSVSGMIAHVRRILLGLQGNMKIKPCSLHGYSFVGVSDLRLTLQACASK